MEKSIEFLKNLVYKGVKDKKVILTETVSDRISHELSVIERQGFADHFILYSRIAEICNELNLIRSCGRGNSINSMVNYCLDITKINPVEENLLFENFVRPEQKHLPDIDIDIPVGNQKNMVEKLKEKHPGYNIYPIAISIEEDVNKYKDKNDTGIIVHNNIAYRIHPCGIIITSKNLTDSTFLHDGQEFYRTFDIQNDPIYNSNKVDILGLDYLNRLQLIMNEIGEEYHPYKLPLNDKQVFDFFATGDLRNIFFFKSPDINQIFAQSKPQAGLPEPEIIEENGGMLVMLFKNKLTSEQLTKLGLNDRQAKAILFVKEKGKITNTDFQELYNVSKATATRDLTELVEKFGILEKVGQTGVGTAYILKGS